MTLEAEKILTIYAECESAYQVNQTMDGVLQVIPIIGGRFEGKISGKVLPGGSDWNSTRAENISHVNAKYTLQAEDGTYIGIENSGMIAWNAKEKIKTTPKFWTDEKGKYAWLNHGVYVASLDSGEKENEVKIQIYHML